VSLPKVLLLVRLVVYYRRLFRVTFRFTFIPCRRVSILHTPTWGWNLLPARKCFCTWEAGAGLTADNRHNTSRLTTGPGSRTVPRPAQAKRSRATRSTWKFANKIFVRNTICECPIRTGRGTPRDHPVPTSHPRAVVESHPTCGPPVSFARASVASAPRVPVDVDLPDLPEPLRDRRQVPRLVPRPVGRRVGRHRDRRGAGPRQRVEGELHVCVAPEPGTRVPSGVGPGHVPDDQRMVGRHVHAVRVGRVGRAQRDFLPAGGDRSVRRTAQSAESCDRTVSFIETARRRRRRMDVTSPGRVRSETRRPEHAERTQLHAVHGSLPYAGALADTPNSRSKAKRSYAWFRRVDPDPDPETSVAIGHADHHFSVW